MGTLLVCYSNHRLEIVEKMAEIMAESDVILVEEPHHPSFAAMLGREVSIDELLLDSDFEYPDYARAFYQLLRKFFAGGRRILQVEPFLAALLEIHEFFADGHTPDEILPGSSMHAVYLAEKEATAALIQFYNASRNSSFKDVLRTMRVFVYADAARFTLRDAMRAEAIEKLVDPSLSIFVEAGHMHRYLYQLLLQKTFPGMTVAARFLEDEIIAGLGGHPHILSPGDEWTLGVIFGEEMTLEKEELLGARSLIYSKAVHKEEMIATAGGYPHMEDERTVIQMVESLSLEECEHLYYQMLSQSTAAARESLNRYCSGRQL